MGRRGPAKTPTRLRVLRGEHRPSQINHQEPEPAPNDPVAALDMSAEARKVWDQVMHEFGSASVIRAADAETFRMYCEGVVRYRESARLLDKSGPLIRGARGGDLVKNPLHQIVRDNAVLVRGLAGELGLTPAARVNLRAETKPAAQSKLQALRNRRARLRLA